MTTPIKVTQSNLPGNMAHMMPAQTKDPKEYQQVQRQKENNIPKDLVGNAVWSTDERQIEPGYTIWREDKNQKQVIAHIEYIEMEDAWFGLHYVKNIPYATMGSKIAKGKYGLKRKGGKTPNIYLWRNDPEPMSEEETPSEKPMILQTAEASPMPTDLETITQGIATILTTNQLMDDEEPLQYFTPAVLPNPTTQVNLAMVGDDPDEEEEERTKTSKGSLKGSPPAKFNGNRKAAKQFLNDFKAYRFLNRKNETMRVAAN